MSTICPLSPIPLWLPGSVLTSRLVVQVPQGSGPSSTAPPDRPPHQWPVGCIFSLAWRWIGIVHGAAANKERVSGSLLRGTEKHVCVTLLLTRGSVQPLCTVCLCVCVCVCVCVFTADFFTSTSLLVSAFSTLRPPFFARASESQQISISHASG